MTMFIVISFCPTPPQYSWRKDKNENCNRHDHIAKDIVMYDAILYKMR